MLTITVCKVMRYLVHHWDMLFTFFIPQVVLGRPVSDVAKNVIQWVRLPILTPDEISKIEKENKKDNIVTVSLLNPFLYPSV